MQHTRTTIYANYAATTPALPQAAVGELRAFLSESQLNAGRNFEGLEAACGIGAAEMEAGERFLQQRQQGVGAGGERGAGVVDAGEVAAPCGDDERDEPKVRGIQRGGGDVGFDSLAKPDAHLLGGVGGDALRLHVTYTTHGQDKKNTTFWPEKPTTVPALF